MADFRLNIARRTRLMRVASLVKRATQSNHLLALSQTFRRRNHNIIINESYAGYGESLHVNLTHGKLEVFILVIIFAFQLR